MVKHLALWTHIGQVEPYRWGRGQVFGTKTQVADVCFSLHIDIEHTEGAQDMEIAGILCLSVHLQDPSI